MSGDAMNGRVTKLEAANRQLVSAIGLFFGNQDAVAVHTLACAAREIYEKHCAKQRLESVFDFMKVGNPERTERELWNVLNHARNFFKHEGDRLDETIEFGDEMNDWVLFIACHDCGMLCAPMPPIEAQAFSAWFMAIHMDLASWGDEPEETAAAQAILAAVAEQFPGIRTKTRTEQKHIGFELIGLLRQIARSSAVPNA